MTAVSLAPDGLSADVFDLVLDGRRKVHAFPRVDQRVSAHSVDIAKWNITTGVAQLMYDSPYHGNNGMCGNLWFNTAGTTIYTACGNSFRSSTTQSLEMVYAGRLQLSTGFLGGPLLIGSLSHSPARGEVAVVEFDSYGCSSFTTNAPCNSRLSVHEATLLNRRSVHSIAPVTVSGNGYRQRGLFVFDDSTGFGSHHGCCRRRRACCGRGTTAGPDTGACRTPRRPCRPPGADRRRCTVASSRGSAARTSPR
jgi:hypothetical protein